MKTLTFALILSIAAPALSYDYRQTNDDEQRYQYSNRQINTQQRDDQSGPSYGLNRRQEQTYDNLERQRRNDQYRVQGNQDATENPLNKFKVKPSNDSD